MNEKAWYILYVAIFFAILVPTTMFLFKSNDSNSLNHRIAVIAMKPSYRQSIFPTLTVDRSNPTSCMESLLNNLQSGNLDLDALQTGLDKCLGLGFNMGGANSTPLVPQSTSPLRPQIV